MFISLAGLMYPPVAAKAKADDSLSHLHRQIVQQAKALADSGTSSLRLLLPKGSEKNVQPIISRFAAETGIAVQIDVVPVNQVSVTVLIDKLSGSSNFDLALPATFELPELIEAGAIQPLDLFAARYQPEDFQTTSLYSVGDYYNGRLYGYQTDGDAYLMFFRKDWLNDKDEQARFADRHGVELALPQTWESLDLMMDYFNRPNEGRFGGALFRTPDFIVWEWWMRFHSKGYWPIDDDFQPRFESDAGVAALEDLIRATQSLHPHVYTDSLFENWRRFSKENIFCNIGWGGTQKFLNKPGSLVSNKIVHDVLPGGIIDGELMRVSHFNWGWNYTVSNQSNHAELAYLFSLFAVSPAISTFAVREAEGFFDPFRSEHYDDTAVQKSYSKAFLDVHRRSMLHAVPDFYVKGQAEYFDALRTNIIQAIQGEISSREAMHRASDHWRYTTQRLGEARQAKQWAFLKMQYPEICKRLLR
ncbi:ABC transporter substrate-binding protein [Denitrobaculum tricleocarpae]|nr:extracellular solute-binding protein [Denitrobaculum tricleocarpae]